MVPRQSSPRDNFTERLYDKKSGITESKIPYLVIPKSYFDVHDLRTPFSLNFSFIRSL